MHPGRIAEAALAAVGIMALIMWPVTGFLIALAVGIRVGVFLIHRACVGEDKADA